MYPKSHLSLPSRLALVCALVSLGALTVTPPANATTRDFRSWKSAYPDSSTDDNLEDPCALCHKSQTKTSQLNGYGRDYLKEGYDFSAIESLNSDDDETGATNLEEINANTQPGWTEGANNTLYDFDGNTLSTNQSAASISDGTLDPAAGNQAPVADIGGPYSGTENIAVKFDGSNSSDSDGNITGYAWDFGDGSSGSGATVSHTYTATGTYNVTLIVTDDAGDSTTASTQITIGAGNQPPVADANGPYTSVVNEQVQFDGSGSSDPDGSIVSYDWDFGDGSNSSGVKPTHTYTSKGTYNVTLTVTDNSNAVDSIVTSVSVDPANQAPTADPAGPYSAKAGESLVFDGTGSTDPDGSISSYAWDFGDGASGTGANPSHTYTKAGTYNVSLKVTDDAGLSGSAVTTASIGEVDKQAPVANVNGPYTGTVNAQLTFSSNGSKDPDGSIVSYSWDFGDGDTASGADVSHTYTKEGSYNVTLTVEDNDGIQDSASTTAVIGVGNLAPTSDAKGPYSAKVNEAVQFDGSGSQDPDGSIAAYDWDFGDGSSGSGSNPTHSYSEPGTYNVTLTVYDDSGALDADSTTVTVEKEDTDSSTDSAHVGTASIIKKGDWGTGFQGEGVITNDTSDRIGIWSITFDADFTIDQIWHAEIVAHTGNTYVIKAAGWNKAIDPGSTVRFGFIGSPGNQPMPDDITVGDMTQPDPNKDDKSASSTQVTMKNVNDWSTAFQGLTTITNTGEKEINGWTVIFDADFEIEKIWNANIVSHTGTTYVIESSGWNDGISPGEQASFGFIASPGSSTIPDEFTVNGSKSSSDDSNNDDSNNDDSNNDDSNNDDSNNDDSSSDDSSSDDSNNDDSSNDDSSNDEPVDNESSDDDSTDSDSSNDEPVDNESSDDDSTDSDSSTDDSSSDDSSTDACNGQTTYGPRELKLLTRVEYQNSIEDLVGIDFNVSNTIPYDSLIEGYFNNAYTPVTESHADAYLSVAEKVAAWSVDRNFEDVVDCGFDDSGNASVSNEECQTRFLNDFATRVFRRPLTTAEKTTYQAVFEDSLTGGDIKVGLELGITALLTSPQFLYRSEVGVAVENLSASTSRTYSDGNEVTVNGADFASKSTGGAVGTGWNIWSEGYIQNSFELADEALFQISMKGEVAQNVWPIMELAIDGSVVATKTVESSSYQTYEFNIDGYQGTHQVQIRFTNDYYQGGEDRNLFVASATVSGTQTASNIANTRNLPTLDSDAYVLTDYEVASFLSYTLTGSTPDEALLTAAENGELSTQAQLKAQIERLLDTEQGKRHMGVFAAQWLGSDDVTTAQKDSDLFPDFTADVSEAMAAEAKALFINAFYDDTQGFSGLFNADYVFVNDALANYYGLGSVGTTTTDPLEMVKVNATSAHRGGVLTLGALMANLSGLLESSPIKRAETIRGRVLCQDIPSPDATIASFRAEKAEELLQELQGQVITNRKFIAEITKESPCSTCHDEIINPLGFGFEDYDAAGLYRTVDTNSLTIDSSGTLYGVYSLYDGEALDFQGGKDLSNKFAELGSVQSCFSANVFRYAMDIGHTRINIDSEQTGELTAEEKEDYSCSVDTLSSTLATSNSIRDLFTRLGTLDLVRYRKQRDR